MEFADKVKVSDGCKFCYAETLAKRYGHNAWGPGRPRRLMSDQHWLEPLKWNTEAARQNVRHRVFCASMADVFEDAAPEGQLPRLWDLIRRTPYLDWQILTKRPQRIKQSLLDDWNNGYPNVWLGTSIEDSRVVDRIAPLVAIPATVRFLSLEPLIGPLHNLPLSGMDWAIVGGESGPGARPMEEEWVVDIREQCDKAAVAFFFKQWGGVNKKKTGRLLRDDYYNNMPTPRPIFASQAHSA